MTGIISEHLYSVLEENISLQEQKDCQKKSKGTKKQVLLGKAVLSDCKSRSTNFAMALIDYQRGDDTIPQSWISEILDLFGVAENTKKFLVSNMNKGKLQLTSNRVSLSDVKIRGFF